MVGRLDEPLWDQNGNEESLKLSWRCLMSFCSPLVNGKWPFLSMTKVSKVGKLRPQSDVALTGKVGFEKSSWLHPIDKSSSLNFRRWFHETEMETSQSERDKDVKMAIRLMCEEVFWGWEGKTAKNLIVEWDVGETWYFISSRGPVVEPISWWKWNRLLKWVNPKRATLSCYCWREWLIECLGNCLSHRTQRQQLPINRLTLLTSQQRWMEWQAAIGDKWRGRSLCKNGFHLQ